MRKLNDRQKMFVQEYLVDFNATQAAIRAGYSKATAGAIGHDLLKHPEISAEIEAAKADRNERLKLSQDYVINALMNVVQRSSQAEPVLDKDGNPTGEYRYDSSGVNRAAELLGKHLKMFTEKVEHSGNVSYVVETAIPRSPDEN